MRNPNFETMPCSKESEMMVLGCMLTSTDFQKTGTKILESDDFFHTEHQDIFEAARQAATAGKPADIHLISEALKQKNKLDVVGGIPYLTTLAQYAGTSAHFEDYAKLVKRKAYARKTLLNLQDVVQKLSSDPEDPFAIVKDFQEKGSKLDLSYAQEEEVLTMRDLLLGQTLKGRMSFMERLNKNAFILESINSL
jgi:Replicative DNA helicase